MFTKTFFTIFVITAVITSCTRAAKLQNRIISGMDAEITNFPYQVLVSFLGNVLCGGSIIKPNFVLSAAHCFYFDYYEVEPSELTIRAGMTNRFKKEDQLAFVSLIIQHKQYNPKNFDNDISILKLKNSFVFNNKVSPIRLPAQDQEFCGNGVITGWGGLWQNGILPDDLQQATFPIMPTTVCEWAWKDKFTSNMICAGWMDGGTDACPGDSGGPLALKGVLVGITSWGAVCGRPERPGVYTKVSVYRKYIDSIINNNTNYQ